MTLSHSRISDWFKSGYKRKDTISQSNKIDFSPNKKEFETNDRKLQFF